MLLLLSSQNLHHCLSQLQLLIHQSSVRSFFGWFQYDCKYDFNGPIPNRGMAMFATCAQIVCDQSFSEDTCRGLLNICLHGRPSYCKGVGRRENTISTSCTCLYLISCCNAIGAGKNWPLVSLIQGFHAIRSMQSGGIAWQTSRNGWDRVGQTLMRIEIRLEVSGRVFR